MKNRYQIRRKLNIQFSKFAICPGDTETLGLVYEIRFRIEKEASKKASSSEKQTSACQFAQLIKLIKRLIII